MNDTPFSLNSPMRFRSQSAFSLTEMLVAMVIIVILAMIITAGTSSMKSRSHEAICQSNLRSLFTACVSYAADNGGRFPLAISPPRLTGGVYENTFWQAQILPYLGIQGNPSNRDSLRLAMRKHVFWCPQTEDIGMQMSGVIDTRSYAMNAFLANEYSGVFDVEEWAIARQGSLYLEGRGNQVRPSQIVFLSELGATSQTGWVHPAIRWLVSWTGEGAADFSPVFRHGGKKNVVFVDGSIMLCGPEDIGRNLWFEKR